MQNFFASGIEPMSKQLTIVVGLTVVGFMAFGLAISFYRNILFEETLKNMARENRDIAQEIDQGYAELEYIRSAQYKDKFAKENLNRLHPGERMIIITRPAPDPFATHPEGERTKEKREAAYFELLNQMPVIEHWTLYLFKRRELEALKQSL